MTPLLGSRRFEIHHDNDVSATCHKCHRVFFIQGCRSGGGKVLPDSVLAKKSMAKGWDLGSSKKKDTCPDCVKARRAPKEPEKKEPELGKDPIVIDVIPRIDGASGLPPREMTREDRRVIFAKLEDVYVDEQTGYSPGWNDTVLAVDLNCPRKWVETIREENFGPQVAEANPRIIELEKKLDEVTKLVSELRLHIAEQNRETTQKQTALITKLDAVRAEIKQLVGR